MSAAAIASIEACVFDAYGTLFDVASAAMRARDVLGERAQPLALLWRQKQLEYTWLRSLMGHHAEFRQVTGEALGYALAATGIADDGAIAQRLMALYDRLDAYPEVPATLGVLRRAGLPSAILSNGSPAMLASAVTSAGIGTLLDQVLSVEDVGIYKPHPSVYRLAVDRLGVPAARICFLSANGWDVAGAAHFGFRAIWVNRAGQPRERLPAGPEREIRTLADLPALLGLAPTPP